MNVEEFLVFSLREEVFFPFSITGEIEIIPFAIIVVRTLEVEMVFNCTSFCFKVVATYVALTTHFSTSLRV